MAAPNASVGPCHWRGPAPVRRVGQTGVRVLVGVHTRPLLQERVDRCRGRRGERLIAAHVIEIGRRIDDVANRRLRNGADRRQQLVAHGARVGIDDEHGVVAHLHHHVAAAAGQQVHTPLHRQHFDLVLRTVGRSTGTRLDRRRGGQRPACFLAHHPLHGIGVFRIDGRAAAERRCPGQPVRVGVVSLANAKRIVRHVAGLEVGEFFGHIDLHDRRFTLAGVPLEGRRADHRLVEIDGIVHLRDEQQPVAVADEELRHQAVGAARDAVALQEGLLHMGGGDLQHPVHPFAGRKAAPQVFCELRRMRPSIEPDRTVGVLEEAGDRVGDQLPRSPIDHLAHVEVGAGAAHRVLRRVRARLVLGYRLDRRVPGQRLLPASGVDRKAGVVFEFGAGIDADQQLFVVRHGPGASQVHHRGRGGRTLRPRRHGEERGG